MNINIRNEIRGLQRDKVETNTQIESYKQNIIGNLPTKEEINVTYSQVKTEKKNKKTIIQKLFSILS